VQQFGDRHSQNRSSSHPDSYVAMTHAPRTLCICFGSEDAPILDELQQSQHFEVIEEG